MRHVVAVVAFLVQSYPVIANTTYDEYALKASRSIEACQTMSLAARDIVIESNSKSLKQATEKYRGYGLPPMHIRVLDGFAKMVYANGLRPPPDEAAVVLYSACAMR